MSCELKHDLSAEMAWVIYAEPQQQWISAIELGPEPITVREALLKTQHTRPVHSHALPVGLNGQWVSLDRVLNVGDRVELYRPLKHDPMEIRRRRALEHKQALKKRQQQAAQKRKPIEIDHPRSTEA